VIPPVLIGPALGAAAVLAVVGYVQLIYVPAIRAEYAREIAAATAVAVAEHQAAALQAAEAAAEAQRERDAARASIREKIIRVPVTTACVDSPALRAALDGLRRPSGVGGSSGAGVSADVPSRAGAAVVDHR
jgi:hypothetical protein